MSASATVQKTADSLCGVGPGWIQELITLSKHYVFDPSARASVSYLPNDEGGSQRKTIRQ